MKDTLIEIRTIYRETPVEWMKPRVKSMIWNIRKQKTTNQSNKKKKESPQNEGSISSIWDNFKRSKIQITEVPEEIGNLFEKIMKENSLIW